MLKRENIKIDDDHRSSEQEENNLNNGEQTGRGKKVEPAANQLFMDVRFNSRFQDLSYDTLKGDQTTRQLNLSAKKSKSLGNIESNNPKIKGQKR